MITAIMVAPFPALYYVIRREYTVALLVYLAVAFYPSTIIIPVVIAAVIMTDRRLVLLLVVSLSYSAIIAIDWFLFFHRADNVFLIPAITSSILLTVAIIVKKLKNVD